MSNATTPYVPPAPQAYPPFVILTLKDAPAGFATMYIMPTAILAVRSTPSGTGIRLGTIGDNEYPWIIVLESPATILAQLNEFYNSIWQPTPPSP